MTFNHIIENIDLWIWDFDDTLIDTDTYYSKSMSVGDILSRSNRDLEQEFPNMAFFKLFVKQLLQANKKVAIASFGTYRIIQAYMDRVFGRGQRIFTKRNILTILRDEKTNKVLEFPNDKNYMIRRLMKIMNIGITGRIAFFDDNKGNIKQASKIGVLSVRIPGRFSNERQNGDKCYLFCRKHIVRLLLMTGGNVRKNTRRNVKNNRHVKNNINVIENFEGKWLQEGRRIFFNKKNIIILILLLLLIIHFRKKNRRIY